MSPTYVPYEAAGWGTGELYLEGNVVVWSELPRPGKCLRHVSDTSQTHVLRLQAFFAGEPVDFSAVELALEPGFYADCARALRAVPRGEVVTYGELAALAGRPGAARAAGTFCGRCDLSPFVPTHRVVGADGIGSYGDLGVDYKRRLLALEGLAFD
jgi:O-6-methylguanine DNA methyltransferase